ncbi:MAG TPA: nicotinate (nicotinamide) nucleotide adenylyltransferase [Anaerolineae bacterium]|nr:nicotinate (nicotinamide) nucleotide adenylyltransferase [Anaerolineae bacterium]
MRERLGIFGGTFDPPHVGHLILAMEAYDQLGLARVLWVLTPDPPHKRGKKIVPLDIRLRMVEAAIDSDPFFELSRVDVDRPGPHYVLDTLKILHTLHPDDELVFLIGGDSLHDIPAWHQPIAFVDSCDKLGVMHRVGEKINLERLEKEIQGISDKIEFIEAPLLEVSSNQIRHLVSQGKPFRYYLSPSVFQIIKEKHLYKDASY